MSSYLAERYHRNKSIRWGLIVRSTSYCWFCISNVRYHLCLWTMCCFSNALLFFFYQNLICFIDTSKKQILMKTRNEEKNIKTHKKPKLYPILFLRKYAFQNIEYVILKWISIKKIGIFVDVADSTTMIMTVIYSIYESNGLCLPFANRLCFAVNPIILLNKIVFIYLVITIHMNM